MRVSLTLLLLTIVAVSLIYSLFLVINLVKRRSDKRQTMKKTFISTF